MAALPSTSFLSSSDMSSVFSDSNRHRNDRRRYKNIFEEKVKKKMKRLAALIASAGCAFMGLCDFVLSREYE
ncbi:hypothetical protein HID58_065552 [Brassica napus]|uniref:Uncharacterized protein n=1 Tax=Brassica napus TaxID=3708 RepID=A0ABQ7ZDH5_BRANA|nr:hypothetical protein HID58_065552 [Brassica napus]